MNHLLRLAASVVIATLPTFIAGASVKDLPVKTVNGQMYHYYKVPDRETVYHLCHKLGVTKEELTRYNPAVEDGLKVGMTLYFPYNEDTASTSAASVDNPNTHTVAKGETIFGISRKYGISEARLIELNPQLSEGLKAGQVITIAEPAPAPALSAAQTATPTEGYIVKKQETLYSIAVAHGISVAELEALNSGLVSLKAGQVINVPAKKNQAVPVTASTPTVSVQEEATSPEEESTAATPAVDNVPAATPAVERPVSIALLLPFMLNEETPSKPAMRATEFYKGFLVAADSLRRSSRPVTITAYDTEASIIKVREILADTAFRRHTAIIAPDNSAQLALIAEYGKNNDVKVFNSFVVKDDSYLTNPAVMQANLPSERMYDKAVEALAERLHSSTPVFLSLSGNEGDKTEFISRLKGRLEAEKIEWLSINAEGALSAADLKGLASDGNYTFIPLSSRQADINKLMPAIIEWRDNNLLSTVRLFGYPEWTMFRGETSANMHNLNTIVYSRFYADYDDARSSAIEGKFKFWYGSGMENVVPRQGLMGFDAGMFVIPYLTDSRTTYDGVQNGYRFTKPTDASGYYNDMLYLINFRPDGSTTKTSL
ncbi:MAG: LysM peptidoglycan-binding domain-containing protein [Duncaniella sp.]|nr:LysM peptidoglycan-binding domain-containing protein [Duncaniella sp.]